MASGRAPTYLLYLLGEHGHILQFFQFESMQIALDQAQALLRVGRAAWVVCNFLTPEGEAIDPDLFKCFFAD